MEDKAGAYEELDEVAKDMFDFGRPELHSITTRKTFPYNLERGVYLFNQPLFYGSRVAYNKSAPVVRDEPADSKSDKGNLSSYFRRDYSWVAAVSSDQTVEGLVSWRPSPLWTISAYGITTPTALADSVLTGSVRFAGPWLNARLAHTTKGITHFNFLFNLKRFLPSVDIGAEVMWNSKEERPGLSLGVRYRGLVPQPRQSKQEQQPGTPATTTTTTPPTLPRALQPVATEFLGQFGYLGNVEAAYTVALHRNATASARYTFNIFSLESDTALSVKLRMENPCPWYVKVRSNLHTNSCGIGLGAYVAGFFASIDLASNNTMQAPTLSVKLEW